MPKILKIAAIVVGVAAVVVTGGAALGLLPAVIPVLGIAATTLGTILTVSATVLSLAAGALAKPPKGLSSTGQQLDWRADPASGEPYVMGDAMVGSSIVHQASWGTKNKYLGIVGVLGICTIQSYDGLYADMTQVSFSSRNAVGYFHDFMYQSTQLGALPESTALDMSAPGGGTMPDWGSSYKTSGLATVGLIMVADIDKGKVYSGGTPKLTNRIKGVKAYDARADSTVTGGSGAQRALTESTYVYSQNPWAHAATYAMGRFQNGVNVIGPGLPADKINWPAFMEAASVADANGWKISGQIYSTDNKWDALKAICQAGGGVPIPTQAKLSCLVNAPKVSLATINESDVKGAVSAPQMFTRRQRLNGAIPRIRSAEHGWEFVPLEVVRNASWLSDDGGREATREIEFALVADNGDGAGSDQATQLAAYAVANSRERGPISVELGYAWSGYKVGDCLTLNVPKARLANQKCVIIGRTINPARNTITLVFQTEDDAKHSWALGVTGAVTTPPNVVQAPGAGDAVETTSDTTQLILTSSIEGLTFTVATSGAVTVSTHTRIYTDKSVSVTGATVAAPAGIAAGDVVAVIYRDPDRVGGAVTYQAVKVPTGSELPKPSPGDPFVHTVAAAIVPSTGSTGGGSGVGTGGGGGGGGGGWGGLTFEP